MIADCPLLGQSACGGKFNDESRCSVCTYIYADVDLVYVYIDADLVYMFLHLVLW